MWSHSSHSCCILIFLRVDLDHVSSIFAFIMAQQTRFSALGVGLKFSMFWKLAYNPRNHSLHLPRTSSIFSNSWIWQIPILNLLMFGYWLFSIFRLGQVHIYPVFPIISVVLMTGYSDSHFVIFIVWGHDSNSISISNQKCSLPKVEFLHGHNQREIQILSCDSISTQVPAFWVFSPFLASSSAGSLLVFVSWRHFIWVYWVSPCPNSTAQFERFGHWW